MMVSACPATGSASVLQSLAGYVDCSTRMLGQSGFDGGLPAGALSACLTIFVALIGYRMLLGEVFDGRAIVLSVVRVGVVTAFCLSWPAFEAVFYRVAIDGPAELAAAVTNSSASNLSTEAIARRTEAAYEHAQPSRQATTPGDTVPAAAPRDGAAPLTQQNALLGQTGQAQPAAPPAPSPQQSHFTTNPQGVVFLLSAAGGLLAVRLAAGLLLAIGPLVIALSLFDSALGLIEGWLRALAGMMLASTGLLVTALLELHFVEAQLALPAPGALSAQGLMLVGEIFCVIGVATIIAASVAARGIRLSLRAPLAAVRTATTPFAEPRVETPIAGRERTAQISEAGSRAQAITDALASQARRERAGFGGLTVGTSASGPGGAGRFNGNEGAGDPARPTPIGQSLRRSSNTRHSASVTRREGRQ